MHVSHFKRPRDESQSHCMMERILNPVFTFDVKGEGRKPTEKRHASYRRRHLSRSNCKSVEQSGRASHPRLGRMKTRLSSSRRSSESDESKSVELFQLQAERVQLEEAADNMLEAAKHKPVAFAVRTNMSFDGTLYGLDAPSPNRVISFEAREFIHIKVRFNALWWIGRLVRIGSPLQFVPSRAKLEAVQQATTAASYTIGAEFPPPLAMGTPGMGGHSTAGGGDGAGTRGRPRTWLSGAAEIGRSLSGGRQTHAADESPPGDFVGDAYDDMDDMNYDAPLGSSPQDMPGSGAPGKKANQTTGGPTGLRRRGFAKKNEILAPYEIVPCMRPVVFVGPALKGYEVTDMMQKAIFDAMKKSFDGRIIVSRVSTNISNAKRVGELLHLDKKDVTGRGRNRQLMALVEVQQDLERIFHLASKMQLLLLDCDTINHPNQIAKTCLSPIVVYLKISSIRVLSRLIRNRGKSQKKNTGVQTVAAEKLLECPAESFDFVVDQNSLGAATEALKQFLESYWVATHPPVEPSKAEQILGINANEPDTDQPLVPITVGHPGLSVVTKSALAAGFSIEEISYLTGARATGMGRENGTTADNELGLTGQYHNQGGGSLGSTTAIPNPSNRRREGGSEDDDDVDGANSMVSPVVGRQAMGGKGRNAPASAVAAIAAGLNPFPRSESSNKQSNQVQPGLAMGLGMGIAGGAAANLITAALLQSGGARGGARGAAAQSASATAAVAAAAAVASVRQPALKELGIHQVESSSGTLVYQSRSARQAKERQAELDRVKRETEAKVLALQATMAGRRRQQRRQQHQQRAERSNHRAQSSDEWPRHHHRDGMDPSQMDPDGMDYRHRPTQHSNGVDVEHDPPRGYYGQNGNHAGAAGPQVHRMARACPPDD